MNSLPKISIVTPSFNQGRFLERTILSVLGQDYPNLEYIIIDGGSTDNSVEIIKKYEKHLKYWVSEPDRGQSHAINKGVEQANGDILGWLNSDDWYHPGALNAVVEAFTSNPEAGMIVGAGEMYFEETRQSTLFEPYPVATYKTLFQAFHKHIMQPSCFFTRQAWRECGPLDEKLHLAMDFDLWLRIAKKFPVGITEQNLSVSLVHQSAKTTALAAQSYADGILIMVKHDGEPEARTILVDFLNELLIKRKEIPCLQNELDSLQNKINSLQNTINNLENMINELESELYFSIRAREDLMQKNHELTSLNSSLLGSMSWKITKPVRQCLNFLKKFF